MSNDPMKQGMGTGTLTIHVTEENQNILQRIVNEIRNGTCPIPPNELFYFLQNAFPPLPGEHHDPHHNNSGPGDGEGGMPS